MKSTTRPILFALTCAVLAAAPASADFRLERRLTLDPGGRFVLEADVGEVIVTGDSPAGASVLVTSRRENLEQKFEFTFSERLGEARVTVKRRGGLVSRFLDGNWLDGDPVRFTIHVPRQTAVTIGTAGGGVEASSLTGSVRIRSSGGGLHAEDVDGVVDGGTSGGSIRMRRVRGDIIAATSGGSIEVSDVQGAVRADTSGGSIRIDGVSGDIAARTSGGGVNVRGAASRVEAHSSGGQVSVGFAPGNSRGGDLSTSGGGVRVEIDPSAALSLDASASGGDVTSDVPVAVRGRLSGNSLNGTLNGGGALLRLRASGGGIQINSVRPSASR